MNRVIQPTAACHATGGRELLLSAGTKKLSLKPDREPEDDYEANPPE